MDCNEKHAIWLIVGMPMGTSCAPLIIDMLCFVMRETLCCL